MKFYPFTQVPWRPDAIGHATTTSAHGEFNGPLATLSAPGFPARNPHHVGLVAGVGCTIKRGDGSRTTGDVTGSNATGTHVNSLCTIIGEHSYPHRGTYHAIVIVTAGNATAVRAHFTAVWP